MISIFSSLIKFWIHNAHWYFASITFVGWWHGTLYHRRRRKYAEFVVVCQNCFACQANKYFNWLIPSNIYWLMFQCSKHIFCKRFRLPYLGYTPAFRQKLWHGVNSNISFSDHYAPTRAFLLSKKNPNFFSSAEGHIEGLGSAHESHGLRPVTHGSECHGQCIWHLGWDAKISN